jgi:hypothetical protein
MSSGVQAQRPAVDQKEWLLVLQWALTQAKWEIIVSIRTLLTVGSMEIRLTVTAASALFTVICVLRVTAAS